MSRSPGLPPRFPPHLPRLACAPPPNARAAAAAEKRDRSPRDPPPDDRSDDPAGAWKDGGMQALAPLRRCASDPVPISEECLDFYFGSLDVDDEALGESDGGKPGPGFTDPYGSSDRRESHSGSVYGPNSPRRMENLNNSESSVFSTILENASRNPFLYVTLDSCNASDGSRSALKVDGNVASECCDAEKAASRRHAGQRSRMRKIQYIAELERTVNFYQTLGADLAARVAVLQQQRVVLSMENNALRQEIANLRRNKMIKEGQQHFLRNELKILKSTCGNHRKSKNLCFAMDAIGEDGSDIDWRSLDIGNLSLGEGLVPFRREI